MDKKKFKHMIQVRVRSSEIDWQGIVHNAQHLVYCEDGRVTYLGDRGILLDLNATEHHEKVVIARNEIDYVSPARFGDVLTVYTRISFIRNSSFAFESIIDDSTTGRRVAENVSIHVYLDARTDEPKTIPESFRKKVYEYEGENVVITWPTYLA